MISLGAVYGGPEHEGSRLDRFIGAATNAACDARGDWKEGDSPGVNAVFYVPGSVSTQGPDKIEAARYSRKHKLLLVAVPVPKEVAQAGGSVEFLIDALHQANAIAAEVFAQKGPESFDFAKAEKIVEHIERTLTSR